MIYCKRVGHKALHSLPSLLLHHAFSCIVFSVRVLHKTTFLIERKLSSVVEGIFLVFLKWYWSTDLRERTKSTKLLRLESWLHTTAIASDVQSSGNESECPAYTSQYSITEIKLPTTEFNRTQTASWKYITQTDTSSFACDEGTEHLSHYLKEYSDCHIRLEQWSL